MSLSNSWKQPVTIQSRNVFLMAAYCHLLHCDNCNKFAKLRKNFSLLSSNFCAEATYHIYYQMQQNNNIKWDCGNKKRWKNNNNRTVQKHLLRFPFQFCPLGTQIRKQSRFVIALAENRTLRKTISQISFVPKYRTYKILKLHDM